MSFFVIFYGKNGIHPVILICEEMDEVVQKSHVVAELSHSAIPRQKRVPHPCISEPDCAVIRTAIGLGLRRQAIHTLSKH